MHKIVLVVISFLVIVVGFAGAAIEVFPDRIHEGRNISFAKDNKYSGLSVTLALHGPETADAVRYGDIQLDEAVDDTETDLIPPESKKTVNNWASTFRGIENEDERKEARKQSRPVPAPQVRVHLVGTPRTATKIARLRGSVTITDPGTLHTAELIGLKPGDKRKMDLPENAGITLTVNIKDGTDIKEVEIEIAGPEDLVHSFEVQDAEGKIISHRDSGMYVNTPNSPIFSRFKLSKPLDETMKFVAKISVDRKITKVPFDLKDIELP